jgi:ATP-dependent Clp protease ATP-binding subunit ClpA
MREEFDDATRRVEEASRDFAEVRKDEIVHTGHLLYSIFAAALHGGVPCLAAISGASNQIVQALDGGLPEGLVRRQDPESPFSQAYVSTLEHSIMNARIRGSKLISISDLLQALLTTEPNVAVHLLDALSVDRIALARELGGDG